MRISDRRGTSPSRFENQGRPSRRLPCDGIPVTLHEIKLYFAYTSPYSYLAMQPTYGLEQSHNVRVRFIPFGVNIRKVYGPLDREEADRRKVRYLYIDARRIAKERGLVIYPPKKIFSARLAFYGGLSPPKNNLFRPYSNRGFDRFCEPEPRCESRYALLRPVSQSRSDNPQIL